MSKVGNDCSKSVQEEFLHQDSPAAGTGILFRSQIKIIHNQALVPNLEPDPFFSLLQC